MRSGFAVVLLYIDRPFFTRCYLLDLKMMMVGQPRSTPHTPLEVGEP
jgi:hypothetical protein